jgi:parallel beta-helix repeat protein
MTSRAGLAGAVLALPWLAGCAGVGPSGDGQGGPDKAGRETPIELYVATQGNDAWSGRTASPNRARTDGPFATLSRARDELRHRRRQGPLDAGATVWIRGGAYHLTETLVLNGADSGTVTAPIVYRAYRKEKPVLIGGVEVSGFVPYQGAIAKADLKACGLTGAEVKQVLFKGQRMILARYPNYDPQNPYAGGFSYIEAQPTPGSTTSFEAPAAAIHAWARPTDGQVWVFPGVNYWNNIVPIASVDAAKRLITLAQPASYGLNPGDRYYVRGLFEELDSPGEWYADKETSTLYFWPPTDLRGGQVSVPRVNPIVGLVKDAKEAEGPRYITLQGLIIEGSDGPAVAMNAAQACAVVGCELRNVGSGVAISASRECLAYGNDIHDTGGSGVTAYSGNRNPTAPDANRIDNNYIHHTGYYTKTASAVSTNGVGNIVSHNLIHDCPRIGIDYNGNDHVIEYNEVRHINLETQDSGATYSLGRDWTNRGHIVRYNYVHDTLGYGRHGGKEWFSPFFTFGIYLDDWSSGQQVYGNIVARSFLAGIDVHSGRDNLIENNIIYDCYREQMRYQEWPTSHTMLPDMLKQVQAWPHAGVYPGLARHQDPVKDSTMSYNIFRRNIISYGRPGATLYAVSGLDYATTEHDYNLIWRGGQEPDSSLAKMREKGLDQHSVVADPQFRDPEKGDFRLASGSPALALGFKPIPVVEIGPYKDPRRASWPIVEVEGAREHPHVIAAVTRPKPRWVAARRTASVAIDGRLDAAEWQGLDRAKAMVLAQEPSTNSGAKPPSYAWLAYDAEALYVGLLNELKEGTTPSAGQRWGGEDGAEVCLQRGDGKGPIFVLQGFAGGHFQSTDHAGAPQADVERLGKACSFAASREGSTWSGEWRIPFAAAGIDLKTVKALRFNLGVRKTAGPAPWVCWVGTGGPNFELGSAGEITLAE